MLYPQRGRTQLFQLIAAYIRDNALNQVTPADFRRVLREIVSSDWNRADDGTNNGGGGSTTQLADFITLDEAGRMQGAANPADGAQPGVLYVVAGSNLKQWNGGTSSETVFVDGLVNAFASTGWVIDSNGDIQPVTLNIAAGTYALGGSSAPARNIYDVPAAKREAVADAIIAKVAANGQAYLDEPDGQWLGKVIVDNRTTAERTIITCHQQANFTTGTTEFCWYRSVVQ